MQILAFALGNIATYAENNHWFGWLLIILFFIAVFISVGVWGEKKLSNNK